MALDHNLYNNWDEVQQHLGEGGGDVTKEYVDAQDNALSTRINANAGNINQLNNIKANSADVAEALSGKLDKLTDAGEFVYSHEGAIQNSKGFEVADEPSGSAAHVTSSKTVKAVKTALTTEINKKLTATGTDRGLDVTDNKVGHTNSITEKSTQAIYPTKIDAQGHVTATGTGQSVSDTYASTADNQLLSRKGAYNMWNTITADRNTNGFVDLVSGISYMCKNKVVTVRFLGNITTSGSTTQKSLVTLPANYRPASEVQGLLRTNYGGGDIYLPFVGTDGVIQLFTEATTLYNTRGFIIFLLD